MWRKVERTDQSSQFFVVTFFFAEVVCVCVCTYYMALFATRQVCGNDESKSAEQRYSRTQMFSIARSNFSMYFVFLTAEETD